MSSGGEQRKQNIPKGSYPQEEVVNPPGTVGVPSSPQAQTGEHTLRRQALQPDGSSGNEA